MNNIATAPDMAARIAKLEAEKAEMLAVLNAIMNARWRPEGMSEENADRARAIIAKAEGRE